MNQIRINIAHYREDLSWVQSLVDEGYKIQIYEKNTDLKYYRDYVKPNDIQVFLCNTGKETHTYLTHIVHNYDDLQDYEVFLQGRVDDHIDGIISECIKELIGKDHLSWCTPSKSKIGCYSEEVYQKAKQLYPEHNHINRFYPSYGENDYLVFKDIYPTLEHPKEPYFFNSFALFGVKKEIIQFYPKSFYEKLLNYFNPNYKNFLNISPNEFITEMPYKMEVLWDFIFKHASEQLKLQKE